MSKKNKKGGIVYSTDPDFEYKQEEEAPETLPPGQQDLRVMREKKGRKGKQVTLVDGFKGSEDDLKELGKMLKAACGTGGSEKNGQIIIQGDFRDRILDILNSKNYKAKPSGG